MKRSKASTARVQAGATAADIDDDFRTSAYERLYGL